MPANWIMLSRQITEHKLWRGEFSRGQAWIDMLLLANWKPGGIRIRGNDVELKRGQLTGSGRFLSARWKWSITKLNRFLDELESDHQIVREKSNVTTVITIVNYDKYQETGAQTGAQKMRRRCAEDAQSGAQSGAHTKKEEEGKEGKDKRARSAEKNGSASEAAEIIYAAYPKKVSKDDAIKAIKKALGKVSFDELLGAVQEFAECVSEWPDDEKRFIPGCAPWMNKGRWQDDRAEWRRGKAKASASHCPTDEDLANWTYDG